MNDFNTDELFRRIDLGIRRGAAKALYEHKKSGRSIVVWKNGRVVWIPPEQIEIDEEFLNEDNCKK